jgi:hypothetical protein
MSGESVALVGVAAGVGAVALLGMAAGAGCALVVGSGLEALGGHLQHRQAEREALQQTMAEWNRTLREVAVCNGRIGVLQAARREAAEAGTAVPGQLPAPLVLGTQTIAGLRQWCAETNGLLKAAEAGTAEGTALAILRRASALATKADIRTGFDHPGGNASAETGARSTPAAAAKAGEALRDDILRVAGYLAAGANGREREDVARAATRVLTARGRNEALNRLGDLRERVSQANVSAAGRRAQAGEAARLLQPLAHAGETAQPVREDLLQVVAGATPLTGELRERAKQAAADLQRAADRQYVRDSVTESLAALGYAVDEGFQTAVARNGILQVTHGESRAHGVRLALDDEKGELRAVVVRTEEDASWDAPRRDERAEEQWCGAQEELIKKLAAKNITMEVRSLTKPGTRRVHVVRSGPARGSESAAPRTGPA